MIKFFKKLFGFISRYRITVLEDNLTIEEAILRLLSSKKEMTAKQIARKLGRGRNHILIIGRQMAKEKELYMFTKSGQQKPFYFRIITEEEKLRPVDTHIKPYVYHGPKSESGKIIMDKIINYLLEHDNVHISDISKYLEMNEKTIYNYMVQLRKTNLVIHKYMEGSNKYRLYAISPEYKPPINDRIQVETTETSKELVQV